ncbi:MAG: carotenoid oxygenase family protein [Chloroflexota bacterium]
MSHTTPFQKGFETQPKEVEDSDLPVDGTLPDWLQGTYVRNGPGQFELQHARYWHWFDGLAMPHRYTFSGGNVNKVGFRNRYLQTQTYKDDNANQKLNSRMSATDPVRTFWQKITAPISMKFTDNTNIHTMQIEDQYVALTERFETYVIDLDTLDTKGLFQWNDNIGSPMMTGHPHYDPHTKTIWNHYMEFGPRCVYKLYSSNGRRHKLIRREPVWKPSYMHSFGMTEKYIILTEYPMKMSPFALYQFLFTDTPFFENFSWVPQLGTIFTVIDKSDGTVVKRVDVMPAEKSIRLNTFEDGDEVVVDLSAYADSGIVQGLYVDTMRSDVEYSTQTAEYRRYRIPIYSAQTTIPTIDYDLAADDRIILPRINYNHYNTKPYQFCYGLSTHGKIRDFVNEIVKIDTKQSGAVARWHVDGHYPSEPVFAPKPGSSIEDEGVLMSTVYDSTTEKSYLLVLDAQSFHQMARVNLPIRIPFGFHGRWYPDGNMYKL